MIMKNLANCISISRIVFSILMLFSKPLSFVFFTLVIVCGITDLLDGYVARNYGLASDFGAKLDSLGDAVFFFSYILVLFPILVYDDLMFLWIAVIVFIKILSIIIGFVKFGNFALIHTYLNKVAGLLIILLPFLLVLTSYNGIIIIMFLIATLAAIEELLIIIFSQELNLNSKSILKAH